MRAPVYHSENRARLPLWIAPKPAPLGAGDGLRRSLRAAGLATVCEESRCPNLSNCFERGTATFMILGDTCTRACAFCAVATGTPAPPDPEEPARLAMAARRMNLSHVVITSVDRDDLQDGGASHFVASIRAVREALPAATVEVLVPDFASSPDAVLSIARARPDVLNHNLETVPSLYSQVRPGASYEGSLRLIRRVKDAFSGLTKSGLMVGLGETDEELYRVFSDLLASGCDMLTVGQYLRPGAEHPPVSRYLTPQAFSVLKARALDMGFRHVSAGPRVRSSFHAGGALAALSPEPVT